MIIFKVIENQRSRLIVDKLATLIKKAGFGRVDQFPLTLGIATLSIATKTKLAAGQEVTDT